MRPPPATEAMHSNRLGWKLEVIIGTRMPAAIPTVLRTSTSSNGRAHSSVGDVPATVLATWAERTASAIARSRSNSVAAEDRCVFLRGQHFSKQRRGKTGFVACLRGGLTHPPSLLEQKAAGVRLRESGRSLRFRFGRRLRRLSAADLAFSGKFAG
jgi:hypothetical protein